MDRQSAEAQKGEIEFRRKLVSQQVSGVFSMEDEHDGETIAGILRDRMAKTLSQVSRLRAEGVRVSPYLELGAERCQRSLVMENDIGAAGAAADISSDMLGSCAHYMKLFGKARAPLRVCCDVNSLPFLSGSIPFVFCYQTLHHFPDPGPALSEVKRVLSSGGVFSVNEEPFRKTLHLGLYKGPKIYAKDQPVPGKFRDMLDFFFKESDCNEVAHGVVENDRITIAAWRRALSGFDARGIFLKTIKGIEVPLFSGLNWRLAVAWLFGGELRGLARKPGVLPEPREICDCLACPACAAGGKEAPLINGPAGASCAACGSRFPAENGVLFLFQKEKFGQLYPDIFRKAVVNG